MNFHYRYGSSYTFSDAGTTSLDIKFDATAIPAGFSIAGDTLRYDGSEPTGLEDVYSVDYDGTGSDPLLLGLTPAATSTTLPDTIESVLASDCWDTADHSVYPPWHLLDGSQDTAYASILNDAGGWSNGVATNTFNSTLGLAAGGTETVAGAWLRFDFDTRYRFTGIWARGAGGVNSTYTTHVRVFGRAEPDTPPTSHGYDGVSAHGFNPYKAGTETSTGWTELSAGDLRILPQSGFTGKPTTTSASDGIFTNPGAYKTLLVFFTRGNDNQGANTVKYAYLSQMNFKYDQSRVRLPRPESECRGDQPVRRHRRRQDGRRQRVLPQRRRGAGTEPDGERDVPVRPERRHQRASSAAVQRGFAGVCLERGRF